VKLGLNWLADEKVFCDHGLVVCLRRVKVEDEITRGAEDLVTEFQGQLQSYHHVHELLKT
jgi:hypothetical protein